MIVAATTPPHSAAPSANALSALSRNASVISSSSSSSSSSSVNVSASPPQTGRLRTFSPPRSRAARSRSPAAHKIAPPPSDTPTKAYVSGPNGGLNVHVKAETRASANGPPSPRARAPPGGATQVHAPKMVTRADFEFGETLGEGSYSEVVMARFRSTGKVYAVKIINKMHLIKKEKVKYATLERDALALLTAGGHPGIIALFWTFQDSASLYFVLSLAPNEELQTVVRRLGSLSLICARYYAAQVVDAVTWMHSRGVIHRDLKPENILLDHEWRIKLTDFGSAKILKRGEDGQFVEDFQSTRSFVGSPQYVSPELLLSRYKYACKSSDLWAIGCIVFQLISGQFLFQGITEYLTFEKIKHGDHTPFPAGFNPTAQDLVERLLPLDPSERLGASPKSSTDELKAHEFFSSPLTCPTVSNLQGTLAPVDWKTIWTEPPPQLEPGLVRRPPVDDAINQWDDFAAGLTHRANTSREDLQEPTTPLAEVERLHAVDLNQKHPSRGREDTRRARAGSKGSRSSSTPSDGTSSLENAARDPASRDGLTRFLGAGESIAMHSIVQIRRDVLGGLLKKARTIVLCLTSHGRLLGVRAKQDLPWKVEISLSLDMKDPRAAGKRHDTSSRSQVLVTHVELKDDRGFVVRAGQRNYDFSTTDPQLALRWVHAIQNFS